MAIARYNGVWCLNKRLKVAGVASHLCICLACGGRGGGASSVTCSLPCGVPVWQVGLPCVVGYDEEGADLLWWLDAVGGVLGVNPFWVACRYRRCLGGVLELWVAGVVAWWWLTGLEI
ncbi:hypothetical protein U1Q18_029667 [Sarracenia purpurea var. burkii]